MNSAFEKVPLWRSKFMLTLKIHYKINNRTWFWILITSSGFSYYLSFTQLCYMSKMCCKLYTVIFQGNMDVDILLWLRRKLWVVGKLLWTVITYQNLTWSVSDDKEWYCNTWHTYIIPDLGQVKFHHVFTVWRVCIPFPTCTIFLVHF